MLKRACYILLGLLGACGGGVFSNPITAKATGGIGSSSSSGSSSGAAPGLTTSGTGSSGGSSSGGTTGQACGSLSEFATCSIRSDCECGFDCVVDPENNFGTSCEAFCDLSDGGYCNNPATLCKSGISSLSGICALNMCNGNWDGSSEPGNLGGTCTAVGGPNTGSCVPQGVEGTPAPDPGYCFQGGTAALGSPCTSPVSRADLAEICAAGDYCAQAPDSGYLCYPMAPGGCVVGWGFEGEFASCEFSSTCECPLECVQSRKYSGTVCENPCLDGGGCAKEDEACTSAGFCE